MVLLRSCARARSTPCTGCLLIKLGDRGSLPGPHPSRNTNPYPKP